MRRVTPFHARRMFAPHSAVYVRCVARARTRLKLPRLRAARCSSARGSDGPARPAPRGSSDVSAADGPANQRPVPGAGRRVCASVGDWPGENGGWLEMVVRARAVIRCTAEQTTTAPRRSARNAPPRPDAGIRALRLTPPASPPFRRRPTSTQAWTSPRPRAPPVRAPARGRSPPGGRAAPGRRGATRSPPRGPRKTCVASRSQRPDARCSRPARTSSSRRLRGDAAHDLLGWRVAHTGPRGHRQATAARPRRTTATRDRAQHPARNRPAPRRVRFGVPHPRRGHRRDPAPPRPHALCTGRHAHRRPGPGQCVRPCPRPRP